MKKDEEKVWVEWLILFLLKQPYYLELCGLCLFYFTISKKQKTILIKAPNNLVIKEIGCGINRLKKYKALLIDHKLIENVIVRNNGIIEGHYIKLNFLY